MKKFVWLLIIIGVFIFLPQAKAAAKVFLLDTSQSNYLDLDNGLTIEFLDWDKTSIKWGIEVLDTDANIKSLGVYPSKKSVAYRIHILSGPLLEYTSANQPNNWQSLEQTITNNKILLKIVGDNPLPVIFSKELISADNQVTVLSNSEVKISKVMAPVKHSGHQLISSIYKLAGANINDKVEFKYTTSDDYSKSIYQYDYQAKQWQELASYNDFPEQKIIANVSQNNAVIAIFANLQAQDGIASFYDQSWYSTFNYQNGNFAASRDYPKGTKLKVTRLKSGESIIIEINDYGPELQTGRLIDLDIVAFEQLGSRGAGLIYVKVELYDQNT